jgi:hypothetical protein
MFLDKTAMLETVHVPVHGSMISSQIRGPLEKVADWAVKECRLPYMMLAWFQTKRVVTGSYRGPTVRPVRHPATGTLRRARFDPLSDRH